MVRKPPPRSSCLPVESTSSADMPGKGTVAEPGMVVVTPGSGVIMMWPVSVCHQVSTIGQRSPPMTLWYQAQARGLIGSPTDPSRRSDERLCLFGYSSPHLMHALMAVGVVGRALVEHRRAAIRERPVDDVAVPGDPADVGRAPVHVAVGLEVEHHL